MESIASALTAMLPHFGPRASERLALSGALGRFTAEEVRARHDLPGFDNSAMDGYALVYSPSLAIGQRLAVRGEARAGGPPPGVLAPGTARRVFTGAPLPAGADTVLIQEDAEPTTNADGSAAIELTDVPRAAGQHVRTRGSDVARGSLLLRRGQRVGAGEIALLAAQGLSSVTVHRRPLVAILSTGDELRDIGDAGEPGTIVNTNAYALSAQVAEAGGEPWVLPTARDALEEIEASLRAASQADVILSAGGVSVGDYDLVAEAYERVGVRRVFWKVAIKPGKPLLFGTLGRTPVVGLPGNPVSAMITFEVFVRPGLRAMLGSTRPYRPPLQVCLAADHRRSTGRPELARARLDWSSQPPRAVLHDSQGSGAMRSMCDVDALVLLPAERGELLAGEVLTAIALTDGQACERPPFGGGGAHA